MDDPYWVDRHPRERRDNFLFLGYVLWYNFAIESVKFDQKQTRTSP